MRSLLYFILSVALALTAFRTPDPSGARRIMLDTGWTLQQSGKINAAGEAISSPGMDVSSWNAATVPSTIMGVLTSDGVYPDIFVGENLKKVDVEQFKQPWWYRKSFNLPALAKGQHAHLHLQGISYYANIWLNGKLLAGKDSIYGAYRTFNIDITGLLKDGDNVLAAEIFQALPTDFNIGFVDWNPHAPDESMGIWRPAFITVTGSAEMLHPWVETKVNTETLDEADLTIKADLVNDTDQPIDGTLSGSIGSIRFSHPEHLDARETKTVELSKDDVPGLHIVHPKLWWCNGFGDPNLYQLHIAFNANNQVSDSTSVTFGIRDVKQFRDDTQAQGFILNGKRVLIRGGGWTDDLFLRDTRQSYETQIKYVRDMNLNSIRCESFWGNSQNLYDLADRYGIMVLPGWSCQWEWRSGGKECDKYGCIESDADQALIVKSLDDQIKMFQHHASIITWFVGSDKLPRPSLEKQYVQLIGNIDNRSYLVSAQDVTSEVSGKSGVKMYGPYQYEPPSYWYLDTKNGGAYGFNTETGPGPQIPVLADVKKMIPSDHLWPIDSVWDYHCAGGRTFNKLDVFNDALDHRYGPSNSLDEYVMKSGVSQYEAMKGMYEAFRVNLSKTTGLIQWMLNSAWPAMYWQLYDYYLVPTSAYYAARKANAPVQIMYNFGDHKLYGVNETLTDAKNLSAAVHVVDLSGKEIMTKKVPVSIGADSTTPVLDLGTFDGVVFLSVALTDAKGKAVSDNFYWLSSKEDEYDWDKTKWYMTPIKSYADYTDLNKLPMQDLKVKTQKTANELTVTLTNPAKTVAFFTELKLADKNGDWLKPIFWNDNYVSLLPGETKTFTCEIPAQAGTAKSLTVSGWNVKPQTINLN